MFQYDQTEKLAIGTYHFERKNHTEPRMSMCKEFYRKGKINATREHYEFDARHELGAYVDCLFLLLVVVDMGL